MVHSQAPQTVFAGFLEVSGYQTMFILNPEAILYSLDAWRATSKIAYNRFHLPCKINPAEEVAQTIDLFPYLSDMLFVGGDRWEG